MRELQAAWTTCPNIAQYLSRDMGRATSQPVEICATAPSAASTTSGCPDRHAAVVTGRQLRARACLACSGASPHLQNSSNPRVPGSKIVGVGAFGEGGMRVATGFVVVHPDDAAASVAVTESFHRALGSCGRTDVGLLVLSRSLMDSPELVGAATEHLALGRRLITVTLSPVEDDLLALVPSSIQCQQWLDGSRFGASDLDEAMAAAVAIDPTIASRVGRLQFAARQWLESSRDPRRLIPFRRIGEWSDILSSESHAGVNLLDPVSQEFLIESQLRAPQARRRYRMTLSGVVVGLLVLAVTASLGLVRADAQRKATEAAELSRRAGELASQAIDAAAELDPVLASQLALDALATASTRQSREAARIVASVLWPQVSVLLKADKVVNAAWAPSGRYLAIATKSGAVKLLDLSARSITRSAETGTAIAAVGFASTAAGTRLAVQSRDGDWLVLSWDLPGVGTPSKDSHGRYESDDGRLRVAGAREGVIVYDPDCTQEVSEPCGWWLPAPGASEVTQVRWLPGRHVIALLSPEGVSVHDLEHLAEPLVIAQPVPASGISADRIAWLSYATRSNQTLIATTAGELFLGDPSKEWGNANVPCIQADLALPPDCHGKQPEHVELEALLGAIDPLSKVYTAQPPNSRHPNMPTFKVSADGSHALVLDVNSRLHLLALQRGQWVEVMAESIGTGGLALVGAAFSPNGSTAAGVYEDAHADKHIAVLNHVDRTVRVESLPEPAGDDPIEVSDAGTRVRFSGDTSTVSGWYDLVSGVWEANSNLGSEIGRDRAGHLILLAGSVTAHEAWPEFVTAGGRGASTTVLRIIDAESGELYCELPTFQPPSGLVVDPDLTTAVAPSWDPARGVRLCDPNQDPHSTLETLLDSVVRG